MLNTTNDQNGKIIVEYIWIGGSGLDLRSKARTLTKVDSVDDLPIWNYDGSSCWQADTSSSEIELIPVALYDDPFRGKPNKLVLCETRVNNQKYTPGNFRRFARQVFSDENVKTHNPLFGIEQEYIISKRNKEGEDWPLGWTDGKKPTEQAYHYCGVGGKNVFGREIADAHYKVCLAAGVGIYGINAEVCPSQWEFQVGTTSGLKLCDDLWMARWLLQRVAENFGCDINFHPKPFEGLNGSGAHTNYSNKKSTEDKDMVETTKQIENLDKYHKRFMRLYGEDNNKRLVGAFETSSYDKFKYGVMDRSASIRIPQTTKDRGCGYYEDRRPASNMDPYVVCSLIFSATCLDGAFIDEIEEGYNEFTKRRDEKMGKGH